MSMKEIAELTGFSISTVSRVLNKKNKCASSETEKKIWEAARKLHYTRNDAAVSLKTGYNVTDRRYRISIVMARGLESLDDEFYQRIEESANATVLAAGHELGSRFMLRAVLDNPELLNDTNGIILIGKCRAANLISLRQICRYIACTGLNPYYADVDQVNCHGEHIAQEAVRYLLQKGHRKIGYLGECNGDVRYFGYRQAIKTGSIDVESPYVFDVSQTEIGGLEAARQYSRLSDTPTAIFCVNDVSAIGLIRGLQNLQPNKPLPAIISIGDVQEAENIHPSLTTVHLPLEEMGNIAAWVLMDRLRGGHSIPLKVELPYYIVSRESV